MTNIEKAIGIIEQEGYYIKTDMTPFSIFPNSDIELDDVKSFIKLDARREYMSNGSVVISFGAVIKKMAAYDISIETNREIANYLIHMCNIADELNGLNIVVKRS